MNRRTFFGRLFGGFVAAVAAPVVAKAVTRTPGLAFHEDAFTFVMRDLPLCEYQREWNYAQSQETELVGLAPKPPYLLSQEGIDRAARQLAERIDNDVVFAASEYWLDEDRCHRAIKGRQTGDWSVAQGQHLRPGDRFEIRVPKIDPVTRKVVPGRHTLLVPYVVGD